MKKAAKNILALDYYKDFKCIGSKCEMDCCNGWNVLLDSKSIQKYKAWDAKNGQSFFKNIVALSSEGDGERFRFDLTEDEEKNCAYLGKNKLCTIVTKFGFDMLCHTCRVYPRKSRRTLHSKTQMAYCSLSCPEVVRHAILRNKPLKIKMFFPKTQLIAPSTVEFAELAPNRSHSVERVHQNVVKIIQNRDVSLDKRLTAILLLCSMGNKLNCHESDADAQYLHEQSEQMAQKQLYELPDFTTNTINQFDLFINIMKGLVQYKRKTHNQCKRRFFQIIDEAFLGFNIRSFEDASVESVGVYKQAVVDYISPLMKGECRVFENLAAHHIMTTTFPFNKEKLPLENFTYFIVIYTVIRNLLAGYGNYHKQLKEQDISDVIFVVHRVLEHDKDIVKVINYVAQQIGGASIGQLYTLYALE